MEDEQGGREERNRESTQTRDTHRKVTTGHTAAARLQLRAAHSFTGTCDSRLKPTLDAAAGGIRRGDALTRSQEVCRQRHMEASNQLTLQRATGWQQ